MGLLSRALNNTAAPLTDTPEKSTVKFSGTCTDFNCILFENPQNTGGDTVFYKKVETMIDKIGTVVSLPADRTLVMLPSSTDSELIAHRISKTLDAKILMSFQADSSEIAINKTKSLSI
jgi:hypothetical protein